MDAESRRSDPPLISTLFDEPYRFEFFQAVRLLSKLDRARRAVGRDAAPAREAVRFRTRASLIFPPSEIYELQRGDELPHANDSAEEPPPEMTVAFMGLTGPLGVLPLHYTELIVERARYKDRALWEFLDLFNHRLLSLFYRAWEKHRLTARYESGDADQFTQYLFCLIGLGTEGLRSRLGTPDEGLIYYGGQVSARPRSATSIAQILSDHFSVGVEVEQFSGQWFKLEADSLTRLGGANATLGASAVAGERVWDVQSKFGVRVGPLTLEQFTAFLPNGNAHRALTSLLRFLAGIEFDFDLRPKLRAAEVPGCVLTTRAKRKPMLGWTTWLKTKKFADDDSQVVLAAGDLN